MAGPRLYNDTIEIFFDTWIGHPQLPRWKNDSVTRLGSGRASTQVTNKTSGVQQSVASRTFADVGTMNTFIQNLIDLPSVGRVNFEGFDTFTVANLIIKDVSYNYTKGGYTSLSTETGGTSGANLYGGCVPYKAVFNISYIVDIND